MSIDTVSYSRLLSSQDLDSNVLSTLEAALLNKGVVCVSEIPNLAEKVGTFTMAARQFANLDQNIKNLYAPDRDKGDTLGYEIGAEWFKNQQGIWQADDQKASYYALIPDSADNKWPREVELQKPYIHLAELIFTIGKRILELMGIDESNYIDLKQVNGVGRMLHYHKDGEATNDYPLWCGEHFDHGLFTGLIPAIYFKDGVEVDEPEEAGLFIQSSNASSFEKIAVKDKNSLLFQVGEFGQIATHDRIKATKHLVKKAYDGIERFTLAVFFSPNNDTVVNSHSMLRYDKRYYEHQTIDGAISFNAWHEASLARYRAR